MRVLIWVQHLLGSGHLRRALVLAGALADRRHEVTLVSGGMPMAWPLPAGLRLVQLPPLRTADSEFSALVDEFGRPAGGDMMAARQKQLLAAFDAAAPDILITEMFPFGRGSLRAEILALLERAKARLPQPLIVSSVRDILVRGDDTAKAARMLAWFETYFDLALVHADPRLVRFEESFAPASKLGSRLCYTGYILDAAVALPAEARDEILVTAGGGAVGGKLLRAALEASRCPLSAPTRWRLVTGMNLAPSEVLDLQRRASGETIIDRHHESLAPFLAQAAVSISQAGYNTVVETLAARTPMVLVPFERAGEDEQTRRAAKLEALGLAVVVREEDLTSAVLAQAVRQALGAPPSDFSIDLDGAAASVRRLEAALGA